MSACRLRHRRGGIERVIEIELNKTEQKAFDKSVESVDRACAKPASDRPGRSDRTEAPETGFPFRRPPGLERYQA
jgi:hypothetical protein